MPSDDAILGQLGEMPGYRRFANAGNLGELPNGWEASASAIGEPHQALQGPPQSRADGAVQVEANRNVSEHRASLELRKQPAGSGVHRAHLARGKKALAIFGEVREGECRQAIPLPGSPVCSPPL